MQSSSNSVQALSQTDFGALNAVSRRQDIRATHQDNLTRLGLIELKQNGWAVTELGQARLALGFERRKKARKPVQTPGL
jgi:hypothetical protein